MLDLVELASNIDGICPNDDDHYFAQNDDYPPNGYWYCLVCGLAVDEQ